MHFFKHLQVAETKRYILVSSQYVSNKNLIDTEFNRYYKRAKINNNNCL